MIMNIQINDIHLKTKYACKKASNYLFLTFPKFKVTENLNVSLQRTSHFFS